MNVNNILTRPTSAFARRSDAPSVTIEVAVDILGDFNISPRSRCGAKFGWNGAPSKDPVVSFTEAQLATVKRVFKNVHLLVRYASLFQVVSQSCVPLTVPRTIMESESRDGMVSPQFRLVAWSMATSEKDVEKTLRLVGLRTQDASFTTGLSALLLSSDHGLGEGDTLKLRLRDGAATVTKEGSNAWRIKRTQPLFPAPSMYDLRPLGR
jgi:hypothetical protein